jgi:hypothetical protein
MVAACAAALAAVLAMLIPVPEREPVEEVAADPLPIEVEDVRAANTMVIVLDNEVTTVMPPTPPRAPDVVVPSLPRTVARPYVSGPRRAPELNANLLLSHIDEAGELSLRELAEAFGTDMESVSPHVGSLLRDGLATGAGRTSSGRSPLFCLTPRGVDRLYGMHVPATSRTEP